jgi:tetratricopeptide (TPR) repeat protein
VLLVSVTLLLLIAADGLPGQSTAEQAFEHAVALQQSGRWTEAEQAYRTYLKSYGPKAETLANLGAVLVRQERFSDAIEAYSAALKLAPGLLPVRLNLGLAYFKSGQLEPAAGAFSRVLEKQPGHAQARQLRAMSLLELERYEEAAQDYAALMPSQDANVRLGLASAYLRLKRTREAQEIMETLFESDTAEVKLLLGQIHVENGQYDEAQKALHRALELNPKLPTVHLSLGSIHWQQRDTAAAIAEWRKELALHPESFQANYTLGTALGLSPDHRQEASRLLRKAVAIKPASPIALYQLAKLVWQSKNREAIALLERSTRADPDYRQAHYLLGTIYQSLGRKQEAAREFAEVRRIANATIDRGPDLFESVP